MATTPQDVKNTSVSGEFDALSDGVIQSMIDEAAAHYGSLVSHRGVSAAIVGRLTALHAAHLLHMALLQESGEGGELEGQGQAGTLKSVSLDRVGSRSFGNSAAEGKQANDAVPIEDWADSSYGKRWRGLWRGIPSGTSNTRTAPW